MCDVRGQFGVQRMPLGVTVVCRSWPWRVTRVESAGGVIAVDVRPGASEAPAISTFLSPFDGIAPRAETIRWRAASRARVRHVVASLDGGWPEAPLVSVGAVPSIPWAHQLVPALALTQGRGVRMLVADDVGLGKTLATGLAIAELSARDLAARVLVLTPSGLRDQWRAELWQHLRIATDVVDASVLANLMRDVPGDCSPWMGNGCRILSVDFAKQPAVLRSLAGETWDILVVDEAHAVSGDSQRAAAVRALALRSRFIILLTATPHSGAALSFRKLVSLGVHAAGDRLVWIRRSRAGLGLRAARRSRTWRLPPTAPESTLHRALRSYASRVDNGMRPEARLAMVVLKKRALSSPDALLCSLQRRFSALSDVHEPVVDTALLPFDSGETDDGDDVQPTSLSARGLVDLREELEALRILVLLAERARATSVKYRTLERLVTRTAEPAILFTEFRDTLQAVASRLSRLTSVVVLHGALDRMARRDAVRQFTSGNARILVATDAAAEGLNLQTRCRFVVHIDLPWSPTTLAQRVGRVDRIGQSREVCVWRLSGAGGHEDAVIAALAKRFHTIQSDLGGPVTREWAQVPSDSPAAASDIDEARVEANDLMETAERLARAASAIRELRAKAAPHRQARGQRTPRGVPWCQSRRLTPIVGRGVVFLFTAFPRRRGDSRTHVAVHVSLALMPRESPAKWLSWLATRAAAHAADALLAPNPLRSRAASRERDLLAQSETERQRLRGRWQPSLFDDRAARVIDVARRRIDRRATVHSVRLADLESGGDSPLVDPVLALIVE